MEKEAFSKLPGWKQINLKKAVGLFQSKKKTSKLHGGNSDYLYPCRQVREEGNSGYYL